MTLRFVFLSLLSFRISAGLLPDLPTLPSSSPSPSASSSPSITPSTAPPTTRPPGLIDLLPGLFAPATDPPSATRPPPAFTTGPTVTVDMEKCTRDLTKPRPKLGRSQRRYALAVLTSAAAVGLASLLYSGVYRWKPKKRLSAARLVSIITSRVLIVGAVKLSAALVASITKASPDSSALDASGAFLTWGSAIFTRLYNEGIVMLLTALGFVHTKSTWNENLKNFLTRGDEYSNGDLDTEDDDEEIIQDTVSVWKRALDSRWETKVLCLYATVYFVGELAVLILNLLSLVGSLDETDVILFAPDKEEGQCPISGDDIRELAIIIFLQCLYALTYQPSLVPLLTVCALRPRSRFGNTVRWLAGVVLVAWVLSLLLLPQREGMILPLFITGDMQLFWFVVIAPPSYSTASYIVTVTYTCLAAIAGAALIFRVGWGDSRKQNMEAKA